MAIASSFTGVEFEDCGEQEMKGVGDSVRVCMKCGWRESKLAASLASTIAGFVQSAEGDDGGGEEDALGGDGGDEEDVADHAFPRMGDESGAQIDEEESDSGQGQLQTGPTFWCKT